VTGAGQVEQVVGAGQVEQAVAEMLRVLGPHVDRDWQVPAGSLEWNCWQTAAHVAHDLLAYAGQVAGRPGDAYLPFDLAVRPGTAPRDVLRVVEACGRLLSTAIAAAGPDTRGWHWGATDPAGFAALGVNEVLLHTYDITSGLAVTWRPPTSLCAAVLGRLFPDALAGEPVEALLWCTGRGELPGRARRTSWTVRAALR
jgi:hypothetical protein